MPSASTLPTQKEKKKALLILGNSFLKIYEISQKSMIIKKRVVVVQEAKLTIASIRTCTGWAQGLNLLLL
jgi:hypothetical protein